MNRVIFVFLLYATTQFMIINNKSFYEMGDHKNDTSHFFMKIRKSFKDLAHFFILSNLLILFTGII